jgi:hypothetical protein
MHHGHPPSATYISLDISQNLVSTMHARPHNRCVKMEEEEDLFNNRLVSGGGVS